ncbi:MAG: class I SAM-dependent methyltransferase [Sulfitobacter sp.]|nr:class I SAM-dependent methyltransferase [Sulfitobacter sp.]
MHDDTQFRSCPACGSANAAVQSAYSPSPWLVAACDSCGFVYLRNPPGYEALKEDFAWEKTYVAKKMQTRGSTVFSPLARRVRNGLGMYRNKTRSYRRWFSDGYVLDIGCGSGERIAPPMTPFGIELSTSLHKAADEVMRARGGYCLFGAGAETIQKFEPEMFDGILMFSYLEHEAQVMDVLKGAYRALKPTGAVFIRVPNYGSLNRRAIGSNWCGFRYPDHVNYFTLQSLRDVATRAGFTTTLVNKITLTVDDNISVLLRKG